MCRYIPVMTTADVYQHLGRNGSRIQNLASQLSEDLDTARFLYQETAHQAIKHSGTLNEGEIEEWLMTTVQNTHSSMVGVG